jgi:hypothetical protein
LQDKLANPKAKPPTANPLLLGLSPSTFVLRAVGRVRSSELEQALLLLPFPDALRLLGYLIVWLKVGSQVRGCLNCHVCCGWDDGERHKRPCGFYPLLWCLKRRHALRGLLLQSQW